ncbi:hypothetical protein FVF58_00725 [Paraburkholderia panacisoli]|uniref:BON domain-containing protein n=1 Tax=Paraburkholderia panacisoli TaxID=2603818 RepID=A0A5B0HKZ0_9BURK|nr:hypothetical protein [Paraburkholderia panacisoli]KAA1015911.1 hypothetical protein FVF58_00725 [Paraburkholderia panacisoli]
MKIRTLSIACVTTAVALLAACTVVTRNSGACEQLMRNKLADTSQDTLTVAHRAAAIRGSRVVVEGTIEHVMTASEVAAATRAAYALAASAPGGASGARATSVASGVGAAASVGASNVEVSTQKPAKPKTVKLPAAAECTFHGEELNVFRWLAPAKLVAPPEGEAAG